MRRAVCWRGLLALGALLSLARPARADSLRERFDQANQAFFKGDYDSAIAGYEALLEAGVDDADVAFNLASAYGQAGRYGQAIRYFERALRLRPGFDAAARGLAQARQRLGERQAQRAGEATVQTAPPLTAALVAPFSLDGLAWALLAATLALSGCLLALSYTRRESRRIALGLTASALGALALLSAVGLALKAEIGRPGEAAIVLREDAPLREGPDRHAAARGALPEGSAVRVVGRSPRFVQVRTAGGELGWMAEEDVGTIEPGS